MSPGSAVPVARPARWAAFLHDHVVFGSRTEPKSSRSRRILLTVRCFCAPQNRQRPRLRPPSGGAQSWASDPVRRLHGEYE